MKKFFLITAIVGVCLLIAGGAVFAVAMSRINWDFSALSSNEYIERSVSFNAEEVNKIDLEASTENVTFAESEDGKITVEYYIVKDKNGNVIREIVPTLSDGVLVCKGEEKRSFYNFAFDFFDEKIVIKVPSEKVLDVSLKVSTGNIVIGEEGKERTVSALSIQVSTGNVSFEGKTVCQKDMTITASTGNIRMKGAVECGGDAKCKMSTGNLRIDTLLMAKNVVWESSTGNIKCAAIAFDDLKIDTKTGCINVRVAERKESYTYSFETSTGESNVSPFALGDKRIGVHTSTGDVDIYFAE